MAINPIQINTDAKSQPSSKQKKVVKPYLEATGAVVTTNNVKPLPPKGHLIKDNPISATKYFFKDIAYDMKAIKDGFQGNANDHQLGRLNDVGLKLGGLGIATYLASRTTNPKVKIMEFVGLGTFLASMELFPKIAIDLPAKLRFGFDVRKQYIDDQGRKKSVMQDRNYVPMDMYRGKNNDEDLAVIGDKLGIPRDIKNRDEVTQEVMTKTATQYHTLWMMTAGAATPIMTALACYGIENYVVSPAIEKNRLKKVGLQIHEVLKATNKMSVDIKDLSNEASKQVEKILKRYEGQTIPTDEVENIIKILSKNTDFNLTESLAHDVRKMLTASSNEKVAVFNGEQVDLLIKNAKNIIPEEFGTELDDVLLLTKEEMQGILKKFSKNTNSKETLEVSVDKLASLRSEISNAIKNKVSAMPDEDIRIIAEDFIQDVAEAITKDIKISSTENVLKVTPENIKKITDFAKIIGDFGEINSRILKLENVKFEYAPETMVARYYNKFQNTLVKYLNFSEKEMDLIRNSKEYATKAFDKRLEELCAKDPKTYEKFIGDLVDVIAQMEKALHGRNNDQVLELCQSIENAYNNTAKRLAKLGREEFKETIRQLVSEDPATLDNSIKTFADLKTFLSGMTECVQRGSLSNHDYIKAKTNGLGSSKRGALTRIYDRYQGAINSFYRIIHLSEVYNRATDSKNFVAAVDKTFLKHNSIEDIIKLGKKMLMQGDSAEYTLKFNIGNAPAFYWNLMKSIWSPNYFEKVEKGQQPRAVADIIKDELTKGRAGKGAITDTLRGIAKDQRLDVIDNYSTYLVRIRESFANSLVDFTKPGYAYDNTILQKFEESTISSSSMFNLLGQSPVDMLRKTTKANFGTKKWFKIVATAAAGVFGATLLAQIGFGKLSNPQNVKKQVKNDASN